MVLRGCLTMAPDEHCIGLWVVLDGLAQPVSELTFPGCVLNNGNNAIAIETMALNALQQNRRTAHNNGWRLLGGNMLRRLLAVSLQCDQALANALPLTSSCGVKSTAVWCNCSPVLMLGAGC